MRLQTVCYELNNYFSIQPPQILQCPQCGKPLTKETTDPTECGINFIEQGLIPHVETIRSHCQVCHWWALREIYTEYEGSGIADMLITVLPEIDSQSEPIEIEADNSRPPWDRLYKLGDHWKANPLSSEIVEWLWGDLP